MPARYDPGGSVLVESLVAHKGLCSVLLPPMKVFSALGCCCLLSSLCAFVEWCGQEGELG